MCTPRAARLRRLEENVLITEVGCEVLNERRAATDASHSCMAYRMALAGVVYVDDAVASPAVRRYLEQLLTHEVVPTLAEIPGHPATAYAETVLRRFANTGVRDQIARLCIDGTAKFPSFLIPSVEAQVQNGGPIACAALALAAWARYLATVPAELRAPDSRGDRSGRAGGAGACRAADVSQARRRRHASPTQERAVPRGVTAAAADLATIGPLGAIEAALT